MAALSRGLSVGLERSLAGQDHWVPDKLCSGMHTRSARVSPVTRCSCGRAENVQTSWLNGGAASSDSSSDRAIATCTARVSKLRLFLHPC